MSGWGRNFGKAAQCLLVHELTSSKRVHHPLHRGMRPVLDLDPMLRPAALIRPISSLRYTNPEGREVCYFQERTFVSARGRSALGRRRWTPAYTPHSPVRA
jgi:hypothetical protein